ncbi:MAG: hypothetical protein P4M02_08385 [Clostridia bacterium]|nr:hypothetical protein [Clostridia bacterium]
MVKYKHTKSKYVLSCLLAAVAGLLGIIDPILTSLLVARVMNYHAFSRAAPVLISLLAVKGIRIYARMTMAKLLGNNQRAPIIWLQHRIGNWLWWLEPLLHNWGWAGMVVTRLFGSTGVAAQMASVISFMLTDLSVSFAAGTIYYFTQSYLLSFLSVLILPTLIVIPWFTRKSRRMRGRPESRANFSKLRR